jgi:dihydrofolate reductase
LPPVAVVRSTSYENGGAKMGKIVVTEFVSLDGVMEDPGGAEGFEHGGWTFEFDRGEDGDAFKLDELRASDAQLLGRVTYEGFAKAWPTMEGTGEFGEKMNGMPKFVVSRTLSSADWNNTTILKGDLVEEVGRLKEQFDGDILVAGSAQLVQGLLEQDLVDELRLMVFPVVLGKGKRLFGPTSAKKRLRQVESRTVGGDGVEIAVYERA